MKKNSLIYLASLLMVSLFADSTWNGNNSQNWSDPLNWDVSPTPGTVFFFPQGATRYTSNNDLGPFNVNSFYFTRSGGNSYSIIGNPLIWAEGGDFVTDAEVTGSQTVANNITILSPAVFNAFIENAACTMTLSGMISGNSGLIKLGAGTLVLTNGSNNYGGGTTIIAGTLGLSGAGTLPPTGAVNLSGAAAILDLSGIGLGTLTIGDLDGVEGSQIQLGEASLQLGTGNNSTFAGNISGTGILTMQGTGTLTLTGVNTYNGGTVLSAGGTLIGNSLSIPGGISTTTLTGGNTVIFNQSSDGVYNGVAGGSIIFIKQGAASLTMTASSSLISVEIQEGTLFVNGSIEDLTSFVIDPAGTLGGTGLIFGTPVMNFGTVAPGNSIGILTVGDDYYQQTGSTLAIEFDPISSDLLNIGGEAFIQPGSQVVVTPLPGVYPSQSTYVILAADQVVGTYDQVISTRPAFGVQLTYTPANLPDTVNLIVTLEPFSQLVTSKNAKQVAYCLDNLTPGADLANVIGQLQNLSTLEEINEAVFSLQPSLFKGMVLSQENNNIRITQSINQYVRNLCPPTCVSMPKVSTTKESTCTQKSSPMNLWFDVLGDFAHQRRIEDEHGFHTKSAAVMTGFDYKFFDRLYVGLTTGYSYSSVQWSESVGKGDINSLYVGFYNSYVHPWFFVNGSVLGTANWYDAKRDMEFGSIDREARHDNFGGGLTAHVDTGVTWDIKKFQVRPFVAGYYTYLHETGYKEEGAGSLDLKVGSQNYNLLRGEIGLDVSHYFCRGNKAWIPTLGLSWIREVRWGGEHYQAGFFKEGTCNFEVSGLKPNHSLISPRAGLKGMFFNELVQVSLNYIGEFGKTFRDNNVHLKLDFNF